MLRLVDEFTFISLMAIPLPRINGQHALCDKEINVDALESLTNSSNVKN